MADIIEIENTTLADVIRRNTAIDTGISDDVCHVNGAAPRMVSASIR